MPCGRRIRSSKSAKRVLGEAEAPDVVEAGVALVEDTHDHAFAVHRRQRRDAQVDFPPEHLQLDAAVLRQPPLGDVELGHDLDAADHGGLQLLGRGFDVVQDAVDPVAHLQVLLERLDVNVARPRLDRLGDDQVDEPDDGGLRGQVFQLFDILDLVREALDVAVVDALDDAAQRAGGRPVQLLEDVHDLALGPEHRLEPVAGRLPHRVDGRVIERVGHRERQQVVFQRDRHELALLHEPVGQDVFQHGDGWIFGPCHRRYSEVLRDDRQAVLLGDVPKVDQELADFFARFRLQVECGPQFLLVHQSALQKHLAERLFCLQRLDFNTQRFLPSVRSPGACLPCAPVHPDLS